MKIICNHFGDELFSQLAAALKASVLENAPGVEFDEVVTQAPSEQPGLLMHYTDNHAKLRVWRDEIHKQPDGTRAVLMDADMIVLGELESAFDESYDIGWTYRPGRLPTNAGVVYVVCNERSRAFMDAWVDRDEQLMQHRTLADHGKRKFGGANQASFMWLKLHGGGPDIAEMHPLACRKWNSVDQTWCDFDNETRVLHIKGKLRDAVVGKPLDPFFASLKMLSVSGMESDIRLGKLAKIWGKYDQQGVPA